MQTKQQSSFFLTWWESPTFTTWGNWAVSVLRLAVLLPFILKQLSPAENAIWLLFMSLMALGNLADIGFTPTFVRMVAHVCGGVANFEDFGKKIAQPRQENSISWQFMEKLYGTIGTVNLVLSLSAATLLAIFGTFALQKPLATLSNAAVYWQAWAVLCVSVGCIFYAKKYEAILNGLGFVPLVNRWNILFGLFSIFASVLVLGFGGNILNLLLSSQAFALLTLFRNRYLLLYQVHQQKFAAFRAFSFEPALFRIAFGAAWRTGLVTFASAGVTEWTGLLYAQHITDYALLASYQLALRFITQLTEFSKAPFYSKLPEFAKLRAAGEIDTLTFRVEKSMQLSLLFFVLGVLGVGFLADWGLAFIGSKVKFVPLSLWLAMGVAFLAERIAALHAQQSATDNIIRFHYSSLFTGAMQLVLLLTCINPMGVWVFPFAQFTAIALFHLWWLPKISIQTMTRPAGQFLYNSLALPLGILAIGVVFLWVISAI